MRDTILISWSNDTETYIVYNGYDGNDIGWFVAFPRTLRAVDQYVKALPMQDRKIVQFCMFEIQ